MLHLYNKEQLINQISKIDIKLVNNQVITSYNGVVRKITNVSKIYEIFDIKQFLIDKINLIEQNFKISHYDLKIKSGIQELSLYSDKIIINDVEYYKSFFILNSSDKSRRLSFNVGLYNKTQNYFFIPSSINVGVSKKHLKGITKIVNEEVEHINDETFDEQIACIKSLVGHEIKFSNLMKIMIDSDAKVNHTKFDSLKASLIYNARYTNKLSFTLDQINILRTPSTNIQNLDRNSDFSIDAFTLFQLYLKLYYRQDSHIIKNETNKILNITKYMERKKVLNNLLAEI